jgi:hypothetical protein
MRLLKAGRKGRESVYMSRVKPSGLSKVFSPVRNYLAAKALNATWLWLSPVVGGGAGLVAWLENLSPTAVLQSVVIAGAMVALGLNQGRAFWAASSPQGKFQLHSITTELRVHPQTFEHIGYRLMFWFVSSADFPMEVEILDARATIQDRTLDFGMPKDSVHRIEPRATFFFDYGTIPYVSPPEGDVKNPLVGTSLISFDYGKPGKAGFKEIQSHRIAIYLDLIDESVIRTDLYRLNLEG